MSDEVRKAVEAADAVAQLAPDDSVGVAQWQTIRAELTRLTEIADSVDPLVVRLGEVTTQLETAEKDAERWRALHWAEAPMVTVTGSQLARGIRPGDFAVPWDWPVTSKTRVRLIAMRDSAREDSNE